MINHEAQDSIANHETKLIISHGLVVCDLEGLYYMMPSRTLNITQKYI